jgi:hypothetical protein
MSKRTIAKFSVFVILIVAASLGSVACSVLLSNGSKELTRTESASRYEEPKIIGRIKSDEITESSGLAASKCQSGVYWTHNDSGDGPFIFAINSSGDTLGTWRVQNAENEDWEDIAEFKDAIGSCFIYVGEIGDSKYKRPDEHIVYRIREPRIAGGAVAVNEADAVLTEPAEAVTFKYPDRNHNAETLMVHPKSGDIYVLTKVTNGPSGIYKIRPDFRSAALVIAEKIAEMSVPSVPNGLLTGGDVAPDGRRIVICDYAGAYELTLPADARTFDDIWKQQPERIDIGKLKQGEAVCYSPDGSSILATSEGRHAPIVEVKLRK